MYIVLELLLCLFIAGSRYELDDQGVLDGENGVIIKVLAVLVEDLCRDGLVSLDENLIHVSDSSAISLGPQLTIR